MKCETCNTKFKPIPYLEETDQASGCAATLYFNSGYYLRAHYGSAYDMQKYALKNDKYNLGNVCDNCIDKFIKEGRAWLIEDGIW